MRIVILYQFPLEEPYQKTTDKVWPHMSDWLAGVLLMRYIQVDFLFTRLHYWKPQDNFLLRGKSILFIQMLLWLRSQKESSTSNHSQKNTTLIFLPRSQDERLFTSKNRNAFSMKLQIHCASLFTFEASPKFRICYDWFCLAGFKNCVCEWLTRCFFIDSTKMSWHNRCICQLHSTHKMQSNDTLFFVKPRESSHIFTGCFKSLQVTVKIKVTTNHSGSLKRASKMQDVGKKNSSASLCIKILAPKPSHVRSLIYGSEKSDLVSHSIS